MDADVNIKRPMFINQLVSKQIYNMNNGIMYTLKYTPTENTSPCNHSMWYNIMSKFGYLSPKDV